MYTAVVKRRNKREEACCAKIEEMKYYTWLNTDHEFELPICSLKRYFVSSCMFILYSIK